MKDFFGEEIIRDEEFEESLAEMLETMPVQQTYLREEKAEKTSKKPLKIRKSMSIADWDDCLK
jgi:hypothetical protein